MHSSCSSMRLAVCELLTYTHLDRWGSRGVASTAQERRGAEVLHLISLLLSAGQLSAALSHFWTVISRTVNLLNVVWCSSSQPLEVFVAQPAAWAQPCCLLVSAALHQGSCPCTGTQEPCCFPSMQLLMCRLSRACACFGCSKSVLLLSQRRSWACLDWPLR